MINIVMCFKALILINRELKVHLAYKFMKLYSAKLETLGHLYGVLFHRQLTIVRFCILLLYLMIFSEILNTLVEIRMIANSNSPNSTKAQLDCYGFGKNILGFFYYYMLEPVILSTKIAQSFLFKDFVNYLFVEMPQE